MILATMAEDNYLSERVRAEDILLGALGFGEDAKITSIQKTDFGFSGVGQYRDGESFSFQNEEDMTPLEAWALSILLKELTPNLK